MKSSSRYENIKGAIQPPQMATKLNLNSYLFFSSHLNSLVAGSQQRHINTGQQKRHNFVASSSRNMSNNTVFNLNNSCNMSFDSINGSFDGSEQVTVGNNNLNECFFNLSMAGSNKGAADPSVLQSNNQQVYLKAKDKQYVYGNSQRKESEFIKRNTVASSSESCKENKGSPVRSSDLKGSSASYRPIQKKKGEDTNLNAVESSAENFFKRPRSTYPFGKCKVCFDKATGIHYGIATCEGCKGFFKRCTLKKEKYRCFFGNNCSITPKNRNRCKSCRFKKCLEVNMSIQGAKMGRIPKAIKEQAIKKFNESNGDLDGSESIQDKSATSDASNSSVKSASFSDVESVDQTAPSSDNSTCYHEPCTKSNPTEALSPVNHARNDYLQSISPVSSVSLTEYNSFPQKLANKSDKSSLPKNISARRNTWERCSTKTLKCKESNGIIMPFTSKSLSVARVHCKELDHEYQFVLSLLGNKLYHIHMRNQENIMVCQQQALDLIYRNNCIENEQSVSLKVVWRALLTSIAKVQRNLIEFAREVPGLADLSGTDFNTLINRKSFEYYLMRNAPLFVNNECFISLSDDVRYTRKRMIKMIGLEMTCRIFKFTHEMNTLRIANKELALIIPFVLTKFSTYEVHFEDISAIRTLNEYFLNAMLHEFDLNRRNQAFVEAIKQLINDLFNLNEISTSESRKS